MKSGAVETLLILGGTRRSMPPTEPTSSRRSRRLRSARTCPAGSNETSKLSTTWHVAQSHYLESWGDVSGDDGSGSDHPAADRAALHDGKTDTELSSNPRRHRGSAYDSSAPPGT